MQPHDILAQFNWEIRGFYNYYSIANNVSATCSKFGYIMGVQYVSNTCSKAKKYNKQVEEKVRDKQAVYNPIQG